MLIESPLEPFSPQLFDACQKLPPGEYFVEYTDNSHLADDHWIQLLFLRLHDTVSKLQSFESAEFDGANLQPSFEVTPRVDNIPSSQNPQQALEPSRVILDQLAQCFLRSGILEPVMSSETLQQIVHLQDNNSIFLIPDTNAIANGTIHWLLRVFHSVNINLVPVTVSLVQLQEHDRLLKSLVRQKKISNLKRALRSRSLVNHSFALMDFFEGNYQVLEVPPELLRYVRPSSNSSEERDQTDVLEDRLLIESIHQVLRTTRSKSPKVVVTADVTLSRVLNAEAIPFLSLLVPIIESEKTFSSVRFDSLARTFTGTQLPSFLWVLLQVFSEIRLRSLDGNTHLQLSLYWPSKTIDDWTKHRFNFSAAYPEPDKEQTLNGDTYASIVDESDLSKAIPHQGNNFSRESFDNHAIPNISLLPVLQMACILDESPIQQSDLLLKLQKKFQFSESKFVNAGEVLLQAGYISLVNSTISPTSNLSRLQQSIKTADLDILSKELELTIEPYRLILEILRREGELPLDMTNEMRKVWPKSSKYAYKNLRPYFVYLGQAWYLHGIVKDGTHRPSDSQFVNAFDEQFLNQDFVSIETLIHALSQHFLMTPWSVKRYIERLSTTELLKLYRFDTATASDLVTADRVLSGAYPELSIQPLSISSVLVGDKPVFTVVRT